MASDSEFSDCEDNPGIALNSFCDMVSKLYIHGYLSDIECRKIVFASEVIERQAAIFQIIMTKHLKIAVDILKIFASNIHPLLDPTILKMIFSNLTGLDVKNCSLVCRKWNSASKSSFDAVNANIDNNTDKLDELNQLFESLALKQDEILSKSDYQETIEMQASIFELMLSLNLKNEQTVEAIWRNIKTIQRKVQKSLQEEEADYKFLNALQNDAILNHLFGFLPLQEIKNCRTVCRQWNSVADPFLRNLTRIRFTPSFRPRNFISTFQYILPDLPFTHFKIRANMYDMSELTAFFTKHGKNVLSLILWNVRLKTGIAQCLNHLPNLTELHFQGSPMTDMNPATELMLPWNKLQSIKTLVLGNVIVNVPIEDGNRKVSPTKIILENFKFFHDGNELAEIPLNDFVDFSQAKEIKIYNPLKATTFDWTRDNINAENITLDKINFVNWAAANAKVDYFKLTKCPFVERNEMHIDQLFFQTGRIDLFVLPHSIEELSLRSHSIIDISQPIHLPRLKFLSLCRIEGSFQAISYFANCPSLVDMELVGLNSLNLSWIPRSVRRMKVKNYAEFLENDDHEQPIALDFIMLDGKNSANFLTKVLAKLRPKILVARFNGTYGDMMSHEALVSSLRSDVRLEKFVVQFCTDVVEHIPSEHFLSSFYEFNNHSDCGKAITREEFKCYEMLISMG